MWNPSPPQETRPKKQNKNSLAKNKNRQKNLASPSYARPSAPFTATATSSGSAIAPIPTSPHASALAIGGTIPAPSDFRNSRCFPVRGEDHIAVFIAGASKSGFASQSQARITEVRRLSQRPWWVGW